MTPEIEPSIGQELARKEADSIRRYLAMGLGENRKKLIAEQAKEKRTQETDAKQLRLPPQIFEEKPKQ